MSQPNTEDSRAVLQRYLDALVAGDIDTIGKSFADYVSWSLHGDLPLSGVRRGRDQVMEFLLSAGSLYAPGTQQFSFGTVIAEGERVALEWRVTGVGAATGLKYDNEYCGVFVVRDGRIAEVREYLDSLHASRTLFRAAQSNP
jgi:ketosteroid isomerase-like protein